MSGLSPLIGAVLRALRAAEIPMAVIGIDVSANEHLTADFRPHWALHPRVHLPTTLSRAQMKTLRRHFPPSDLIPRPLKVATFDGNLAGLAYGMKPEFGRRQSYEQVKPTETGTRACRNTRGVRFAAPRRSNWPSSSTESGCGVVSCCTGPSSCVTGTARS